MYVQCMYVWMDLCMNFCRVYVCEINGWWLCGGDGGGGGGGGDMVTWCRVVTVMKMR